MIYDKILSQILCFRPFNRKRQAGVFKNSHSGPFLKTRVFGAQRRKYRLCVNGRLNLKKKSPFFKSSRIRMDLAFSFSQFPSG